MLRSIPQQLLRDSATIKVCTGMDVWQNPTWEETTVNNVHLQNANETKKTVNNTEVVLQSTLFVDGRRSLPVLDYGALVEQSQANGKPLRATVYNASGVKLGDYEILTVDCVTDIPADKIHHIELGMV